MIIYLCQLSHQIEQVFQNRCFPLAIGYIGSYLLEKLGNDIKIELFKSPIELNQRLLAQKPDVVMFSNYLWNEKLNLEFAKEIKTRYHDILTVIGGPNLSLETSKIKEFLQTHNYIDLYCLFRGEELSEKIISNFNVSKSIEYLKKLNIQNKYCLVDGELVGNNESEEKENTTKKTDLEYPSPYLNGLFDKFFLDGLIPLIEIKRGCPFSCSFCQQGNPYFNKLSSFSINRVKEEMEYISNKIYSEKIDIQIIEIADSNFGMYEADSEVTKIIREIQDKYDFPKYIGSSTGKNKIDLIFKCINNLKEGSIFLRCAVQSLHQPTLDAIKRKNIDSKTYYKFNELMEMKGFDSNADIMLCLPLETIDSHFDGIYQLIDSGIKEFSALQTIVLKGTEFEEEEFSNKYLLQTKSRLIPECINTYKIFDKDVLIAETERIIISTSTMSFEDYLNSRKMHFILMIYHNTRLVNLIYDFLGRQGIFKHKLIQAIYNNSDSDFNKLIDGFITDTKCELFEDLDLVSSSNEEILTLSYNKIFKNLSIALYKNQNVVIRALTAALYSLVSEGFKNEIDELTDLTQNRIISLENINKDILYRFKSHKLIEQFGTEVRIFSSDNQITLIKMVNNIYTNEEDKINKMIYHLRPGNTVKNIEYLMKEAIEAN